LSDSSLLSTKFQNALTKMPILKDGPVFDPTKDYPGGDCYSNPRRIIIEGTQEEMGYELAKVAQRDYGVKSLAKYTNVIYGEAHKEYVEMHFPNLARTRKGVLKAFGLEEDDSEHDATQVPYDITAMPTGDDAANINFCSFVNLPIEKSGGSVITSRNLDFFAINIYKGFSGKPNEEGEYNCYARSLVMEKRPTDGGYKSLLVGGTEALYPYLDGMNEKGLYFTVLSDPWAVGKQCSMPSGGDMNGICMLVLGPLLLEKCATVKEAKKEILKNRVLERLFTIHMVLVDATGDSCIFEIDAKTQHYVFVDRKPNEPLFCTNHPVSSYPDPSTYREFEPEAEHNTFHRMNMLHDMYNNKQETFTNKGAGPLTKEDAIAMTDSVHCAFVDDKKAEAGYKERTLWNTTADLTKKEFYISFYVRDIGPRPGTSNQMEDLMTKRYTIGFD